jgi:hypothetical protein
MMGIEHKYLDILAQDLADSIDTKVLYTAQGWTIVTTPSQFFLGNCETMLKWIDTHCGEHHYWDGHIAFEQARDATLFLLKWS